MFIAQEPGDYSGKVLQDEFDSVLGDRVSAVGTYKGFVPDEERAIYPEYIVLYKRLYSEKDVFKLNERLPVKQVVVPTTFLLEWAHRQKREVQSRV